MENRLKTLEQELRSLKKKRCPVEASSTGDNSDNVASSKKKCENNSDILTKCDIETSRKISVKTSDSWKKSEWKRHGKPRHPKNSYSTPTSVSPSSNYIDKYKRSIMRTGKESPGKYSNTHVRSSKFGSKLRCSPNWNDSGKYLYRRTQFSSRKYDKFERFTKNDRSFDAADVAHCSTRFSSIARYRTHLSSRKYNRLKYFAKNDHDFCAFNATYYSTLSRSRKCDGFKYFGKNEDGNFDAVNGSYEAHTYYNITGKYATTKRPLNGRNERNIYSPRYSQTFKFVEKYKYFRGIQKTTFPSNYYYEPRESSYRLNRQQVTRQQLDYELDSYRCTKLPITKEELDYQIDRYMVEVKGIEPVTETNDVDCFVKEYMLEAEKCLNVRGFVDTLN